MYTVEHNGEKRNYTDMEALKRHAYSSDGLYVTQSLEDEKDRRYVMRENGRNVVLREDQFISRINVNVRLIERLVFEEASDEKVYYTVSEMVLPELQKYVSDVAIKYHGGVVASTSIVRYREYKGKNILSWLKLVRKIERAATKLLKSPWCDNYYSELNVAMKDFRNYWEKP